MRSRMALTLSAIDIERIIGDQNLPRRHGDTEKSKEIALRRRGGVEERARNDATSNKDQLPETELLNLVPRKTRRAQKQKLFAAFASFAVNLFLLPFQRLAREMIERVGQ